MKFAQIVVFLVAVTLLSACSAYRILGVFPFNAKSHNIVFEALMKGLAKRGHQVEVVSHFPLKKPMENYTDIFSLEGAMESLMNNYTVEFVSKINVDVIDIVGERYGNRLCDFLGFNEFQKLIKNPPQNPPYDVLITEAFGAHCFMGLGYVLNVPVVAVSSSIDYPWVSDFIGNNDNPATIPNAYLKGAGKMDFWDRMKNVLTNFQSIRHFHDLTEKSQTEAMRKYLKPDMPSIREVERNVALTLVNSNQILFGVRPVIPTLVQIAGLHIEENEQTLSLELQKWMDESKEGVVYFTLGSMVLIESLPAEQLTEIFASFEKIAPVRVLMKIVDPTKLPSSLPKNVKIMSWIPQQPVLAHPNTKVFMTHCGLGGLIETLYYGVPLIGLPLFGDQFRNAEAFIEKGMMIRMDFNKLSGETLDLALREILGDPTYKKKALYYSKLFRDQPLSPMNNAIFWIEYVIRNGGNVLRPLALEFSWWQLALLDVYAFLLLVSVTILVLGIFIIKLALKRLNRKHSSVKKQKKKVHKH